MANYKYDPMMCMNIPVKGARTTDSWTTVYKEFEKIIDKYFPNQTKISQEVKNLYLKHKGEPDWDEAYKRWMRG